MHCQSITISVDLCVLRDNLSRTYIVESELFSYYCLQEPLMEVMSPGTKNLQTYMINRLLVYMCREFRAAEKRHFLPCIRADELPSQFPFLSEAFLRKKLKEHANLQALSFCSILFWYIIIIFLFTVLYSTYHSEWICNISRGDQMDNGCGLRNATSEFSQRMN